MHIIERDKSTTELSLPHKSITDKSQATWNVVLGSEVVIYYQGRVPRC
jgi:hypothetical protein